MTQSPVQPQLPLAAHGGARIDAFDAMRGIGLIGVLITHCWWIKALSPFTAAVRHMLLLNFITMDMFFVLSGYLITGILLRSLERPRYFRTFYIRRALRILPAYYFVLLVVFYLQPMVDPMLAASRLIDYQAYYWLHLQNWLLAVGQPGLGWLGTHHFWSLAVEEQFYLLWPLLIWQLRDRASLRRACLTLVGLCYACKLVLVAVHADWAVLHMSTITRMDALAIGGFIATVDRATAQRYCAAAGRAIWPLFALIVAVVIQAPDAHSAPHSALMTTLAGLLFGAVTLRIHGGTRSWADPLMRVGWLQWLGRYSYGIYLVHLPLVWLIRPWILGHGLLDFIPTNPRSFLMAVGTIAVSLLLAWLMHRWLEQPAMDLRHRLAPDRNSPTEQAEPASAAAISSRA